LAIFQLIVSAMSALNQVAVFAAALVFGGVGLLLVGNAIYWRLHAARVQGEVIGVRRNRNRLNAVYRYDSPAGESFEATSIKGSDSVRGKETGRVVPLWVIPEKPHEVQERGNHFFTVLGLGFLGSGVALFWVGATGASWRRARRHCPGQAGSRWPSCSRLRGPLSPHQYSGSKISARCRSFATARSGPALNSPVWRRFCCSREQGRSPSACTRAVRSSGWKRPERALPGWSRL
jgi:hypothetical protein